RPAGKLRIDDPDYFETRFEWNNDSLCTRIVHPRGNTTEMAYQRAFNQNSSRSNNGRIHNADLRILRERACCNGADTDGDGTSDLEQITERFEHDSRFGAGTPVIIWRDDGDRGFDSRAKVITDRDTGRSKGFGFVTLATDPLGTLSSGTYDPHGNLIHTETTERKNGYVVACDFNYNPRGQRTSMTHPAGGDGCRRVDTLEYYETPGAAGFGYLKKVTKDNGSLVCGSTSHFLIATSYEYDSAGNVTRCTDPNGFDTLFTYNALDQLVRAQTPPNTVYPYVQWQVDLSYDANDNIVRMDTQNRDHTGALGTNPFWRTEYQYDVLDRMTACCIDKDGNLVYLCDEYQYDGNGNLTVHRSPEAVAGRDPNAVTRFDYDERDLPFHELRAPGTGLSAMDQSDYDANGNCRKVSKVDAFTVKQTIIEHDGFDRPVRVTDAMGNIQTSCFDANGNLVYQRVDGEVTDVPGKAGNLRLSEIRSEYDSLSRHVRSRQAFFDILTQSPIGDGEATTSFTYAPDGALLSETDDNGHTTRYTYDSAGRVASVIDPKTNIVLYAYDACGNPT